MSESNRIGPLQAVKVLINVAERLQRFEPYFDQLENSLKMLEELREEYGGGEGTIIDTLKERLSDGVDKALGDLVTLADNVKDMEKKLNRIEKKLDGVIKREKNVSDSKSKRKSYKR